MNRLLKSFGALAVMAVFATAANAALIPADFSGTRTAGGGGVTVGGIDQNSNWSNFQIDWNITQAGGLYTYVYTFTSAGNPLRVEPSHFILQVSDSFTSSNILSGTDPTPLLDTHTGPSPGNPGMPGNLYGIKWDALDSNSVATGTITLVTDRAPVWGSFYAKGGSETFAYNSSFVGSSTRPEQGETDFKGWIATPDTNGISGVVPEPASIAVFGALSGLLGFAGLRRRKQTS